jgi:hypothetical protein
VSLVNTGVIFQVAVGRVVSRFTLAPYLYERMQKSTATTRVWRHVTLHGSSLGFKLSKTPSFHIVPEIIAPNSAWAVVNAIKIGKCIDELVQVAKTVTQRITFSAIMTFCDSQPSPFGQCLLMFHHCVASHACNVSIYFMFAHAVSRGGPLMHFHMMTFARQANRRRFIKECKSAAVSGDWPIDSLLFDELISQERVRFCARLIVAAGARGSNFNQQLYYYQMVASFRGLSRSGSSVLNVFGCGLAIRTFDRFRKAHQERVQIELG